MWHGLDMYGLICISVSDSAVKKFCHIVSGVGKTYTTVSTVCSSALLWCLVDLDVLDNQVASIETLGIGVGLCVLEETEKELGGLDWPSSTGDTELLS